MFELKYIQILVKNKYNEVIRVKYHCGEKPGVGTYVCTNDAFEVHLDDSTDKLPPCPKCENCEYEKM